MAHGVIKEFNTAEGLANIDLTRVLSARDSTKLNSPTVYIRLSNGDFYHLVGTTLEEFVTMWKTAKE